MRLKIRAERHRVCKSVISRQGYFGAAEDAKHTGPLLCRVHECTPSLRVHFVARIARGHPRVVYRLDTRASSSQNIISTAVRDWPIVFFSLDGQTHGTINLQIQNRRSVSFCLARFQRKTCVLAQRRFCCKQYLRSYEIVMYVMRVRRYIAS